MLASGKSLRNPLFLLNQHDIVTFGIVDHCPGLTTILMVQDALSTFVLDGRIEINAFEEQNCFIP